MKKRVRPVSKKKRTTISISPELLHKGAIKARETRRNFSNYIEVLIAADIEGAKGGVLA